MNLPEASRFRLAADLDICRVLHGMWQVSGGHGEIPPVAAVGAMFDYQDEGFTTWDLADHYGPAEEFVGEFRRQLVETRGESSLSEVQALTKWVPRPGPMTKEIVEQNVNLSLRRMNVESLDLLQFHWWDYRDDAYLEAMGHLAELRVEGKIKHLALTNFDTEHLERIVDHGVTVVSNQVQFSLIDRRPEVRMAEFCQERGIHLLSYGALCGGLLAQSYLGQPEPSTGQLNTASLRKYKQMIDAWGGWALFQDLLATLGGIGAKHGVSLANVGVRYILDRPAVAGVIVGVRLGVSEHRADTAQVFDFSLDEADLDEIEAVLSRSCDLYQLIGDCGDEYRR